MKTLITLTLLIMILLPGLTVQNTTFILLRQSESKTMQVSEEIAEKIHTRDKIYKKFKSTKLHVDEEIYNEARNKVQNLIRKKKKAYFEEKIKENTVNPKKL